MSETTPVGSRILTVPKAGADEEENEDAAAVWASAWPVRAAVADGATESMFSKQWARTLVEGLETIDLRPSTLTEALPAWRADWKAAVADRTEAMPWYASAKADEGTFATLLGLELRHDGHWEALAVGDCTLMHVHQGRLETAWPHASPDAFSNRPSLLSTLPDRNVPTPDATTGMWHPGDAFLLATDAVAAWLLKTDPVAARTWTAQEFAEAVEAARANDSLRNDDSTLVVLELATEGASETYQSH